MKKKTKKKMETLNGCSLIAWSLKDKDGKMRPPSCPECFQPAEVALDMIGRPAYFHAPTGRTASATSTGSGEVSNG